MPKRCPAYGFRAVFEYCGKSQLWLTFENAGPNDSPHDFSFATGLIEELQELAQAIPPRVKLVEATTPYLLADVDSDALGDLKPVAPSRYQMPMPRAVIQSLMPTDLLVNPAGMTVQWETPKAVVKMDYEVWFLPVPASGCEAAAFARDRVVQQVCSCSGDPNEEFEQWVQNASAEFEANIHEVTREKIVERLWQLREFTRAYSLQQRGIFDYDQPH